MSLPLRQAFFMLYNIMKDFLLTSLIASVVLTLALNFLPAIFPNAVAKAEQKIVEKMQENHEDRTNPNTPKVRVFFPWKAMLLISLFMTVAVNLIGFISR